MNSISKQRWRLVLNVGILVGFFLGCSTVKCQITDTTKPLIKILEELAHLPEPVTNCAVTSILKDGKEYVYVFGGIDSTLQSSGIHRRCYRVNANNETDFIRLQDIPDTLGKIALSATRVGTKAYIVGGYHVFANGEEKSSKLVHEFDLIGDTFTSKKIELPLAIDDHVQALWNDSLIYIINGWSDSTNVRYTQIYNVKSNSWQIGTPFDSSMTPTFGATGVIRKNTIFIQGGARSDRRFFPASHLYYQGEIDRNNPSQIKWSSHYSNIHDLSYRSATINLSNLPYPEVVGGSKLSYNYNGLSYEQNQQVSPEKRSLVLLDNGIGDILHFSPNIGFGIQIPMDIRDWTQLSIEEYRKVSKYGIGDSALITGIMFIAGGIKRGGKVSNQILKISAGQIVGIQPRIGSQRVTIFPNPTHSKTQISYPEKSSGCLIVNAKGTVVLSTSKVTNKVEFDLSLLPSGIYFFLDSENQITKKIIKK